MSWIGAGRGEEGCCEPIVEGPLQVAGCRVCSALTAPLASENVRSGHKPQGALNDMSRR